MSRVQRPRTPRVAVADQVRLALDGLAARRTRSALSALGIAIGVAALVGVLGLSESSRADLMAELDRLGTTMLTVTPGQSSFGDPARLPEDAPAMVGRIADVAASASLWATQATVRRTDLVPEAETGGIVVQGADLEVLSTVRGTVASGRWLDQSLVQLPAVVLGADAARRLGIAELTEPRYVWLGEEWFAVVGILDPVTLAPDLDDSALVGTGTARRLAGDDLAPSAIHVRAAEGAVEGVRALLARTANPESPTEPRVSRPSDALAAQVAARGAFTALFLGLGGIVLLVGAIGVANVMVVAVLERRREIGVRRALGATRGAISRQFVTEAVVLSGVGGVLGSGLGALATAVWAGTQGWAMRLPPGLALGGVTVAILVGAAAGLYPAVRASRVPPTEALRA